MKKLSKIVATAMLIGLAAPTLSSCGVVKVIQCIGKEQIKIFNWGAYIDPEVLTAFEEEHNVCVSYSTFNSNEEAIAKLQSGEVYDVIFPSDYAVEQLVEEDYIQTLDWDKITAVSNSLSLEETGDTALAGGLKTLLSSLNEGDEVHEGFNFLNYAAPYFWGSVGILYDTENVTLEELEELQWDVFKTPVEGRRYAYYDSSRDGFMAALKQLGYSMNTSDQAEIDAAKQWLIQQKQALGQNLSYVGDTVIEDMAATTPDGDPANTYDLALMYSGDAVYAMSENENLAFFQPSVGTNVWVDGMVIHKNSTKVDLAYDFMNFMMSEEIATANTLYVAYSSPLEIVYETMLEDSEEGFADYEGAYRVNVHGENDEIFRFDRVAKSRIDDAWVQVKQASIN